MKKEDFSLKSGNYSKKSFIDVSSEWLETIYSSNKLSTYIKYRTIINKYFLPVFSNAPTESISDISLKELVENVWSESQEGPSQSTVRSVRSVYLSLVKYCNIEISQHLLIWQPSVNKIIDNKRRITTFSFGQQRKLVKFLLNDTDVFKAGILVCLYTGIRIGEICALRAEDIQLKEKKIFVNRTVQRLSTGQANEESRTKLVESPPKTASSLREIPICSFLCSILPSFLNNSKYFLGDDGPLDPRNYQYKFKKYQNLLGFKELNFHALRHTFATNCISGGMDPKTLSVILGHADVKTTLNRYVHPSDDIKLKQLNKCIKHFPVKSVIEFE